jgi:4-amino-4-deoxy-L-arabinose transferase-like glycosyltransferase
VPADTTAAPAAHARRPIERLLLILILALSAWVQSSVANRTVVDTPLRADAAEYFSYAVNLGWSGTYSANQDWRSGSPAAAPQPDKVRSPGYPLFLRLIGRPVPSPGYLHRVATWQAALGVLSVFLAWCIARRMLPGWAALATTALCAINPHLATIGTYLLSESLFTALLLASVLATCVAFERRAGRWWLYAGLAWGACALVRPTVEFLPLLFLLASFAFAGLRDVRRGAALAMLGFALVQAPWVLRNLHVPAVPGTSLMAKSLVHGSYPGFMYQDKPESFGFPYRFDPDSERASSDVPSALGRIAANFRDAPLRQAGWYLFGKPGWFLSWGNVQAFDVLIYPAIHTPYYEDARFALMRMASLWLHWPLMLLGLAGAIWVALRPRAVQLASLSRPGSAIVAWVVLYAVAAHAATAPFPRYSIPFRPLLFALALLVLVAAWRFLRSERSNRLAGSASVSANRPGSTAT